MIEWFWVPSIILSLLSGGIMGYKYGKQIGRDEEIIRQAERINRMH